MRPARRRRPGTGTSPGHGCCGAATSTPPSTTCSPGRWRAVPGCGCRRPPRGRVGLGGGRSFGVGPVRVRVPCRVVYVIHEPYLPRGFRVRHAARPSRARRGAVPARTRRRWRDHVHDHRVLAAGDLLTRLGGPVGHWVQDRITGRYLRALDEADLHRCCHGGPDAGQPSDGRATVRPWQSTPAEEIQVGPHPVRISNPDRVYFSARGETKLEPRRVLPVRADGICARCASGRACCIGTRPAPTARRSTKAGAQGRGPSGSRPSR